MKLLKEFGRDAYVDWATILLVCVILAASLAFVNFSLYNAVVGGKVVNKDIKATTYVKPNEEIISSVDAQYGQRDETSKKARTGYAGAPDPSI